MTFPTFALLSLLFLACVHFELCIRKLREHARAVERPSMGLEWRHSDHFDYLEAHIRAVDLVAEELKRGMSLDDACKKHMPAFQHRA